MWALHFQTLLGCVEERYRKFLVSFAQELACQEREDGGLRAPTAGAKCKMALKEFDGIYYEL